MENSFSGDKFNSYEGHSAEKWIYHWVNLQASQEIFKLNESESHLKSLLPHCP